MRIEPQITWAVQHHDSVSEMDYGVNFQSWLDPLIIIMALPGALAGILWMLFATETTLNVPALMGAIMSIGVATANSILLVTFANEQRQEGDDAIDAALSAGFTRECSMLMTALAMLIGMLPMALGLGEGGEQNAPLGRAVIGGLSIATSATLFFVPVVYSRLRHKPSHVSAEAEVALPEQHVVSWKRSSAISRTISQRRPLCKSLITSSGGRGPCAGLISVEGTVVHANPPAAIQPDRRP